MGIMKHVLLILLAIGLFSSKARDLRLGVVNGDAAVKNAKTGEWVTVSSEETGMILNLNDSVRVSGESLFVRERGKKGKRTKIYQADCGLWTVRDIVKGKAYHVNRAVEISGESVKGNMNHLFFDLLVAGRATTSFHFGDIPLIRVINDNDNQIYYAPVWVEGDSAWKMLDAKESICLAGKCSTVEFLRDGFMVAPPKGNGLVILIVSDAPFNVETAIKSYSTADFKYHTLIKNIEICE